MKELTKAYLATFLLFLLAVPALAQYKLWYNAPAQVWTDALPLGNG